MNHKNILGFESNIEAANDELGEIKHIVYGEDDISVDVAKKILASVASVGLFIHYASTHVFDGHANDLKKMMATESQENIEPLVSTPVPRVPNPIGTKTEDYLREIAEALGDQGITKLSQVATGIRDLRERMEKERPYRSDAEIVEQTLELTKYLLLWRWGLEPEGDVWRIWESRNTQAIETWDVACHIQDLLTATDVKNAIENLDVPVNYEAPPRTSSETLMPNSPRDLHGPAG